MNVGMNVKNIYMSSTVLCRCPHCLTIKLNFNKRECQIGVGGWVVGHVSWVMGHGSLVVGRRSWVVGP